jgi:hypothetical protein
VCSLLVLVVFLQPAYYVCMFAGALCIGVTSESVCMLREMAVKEVFWACICLDVISWRASSRG